MKQTLIKLILCSLLLSIPASAKEVVGWVEKVHLFPGDLPVKAKIDTGAKTSSLNCLCKTSMERNGEKWVRFSVTNYDGEQVWFERKVIRSVTIKRHYGDTQIRDVVRLGICLGSTYKEVEVNLIDRSGLNYQLLIGRQYLKGRYLVDPSRTFVSSPSCAGVKIGD